MTAAVILVSEKSAPILKGHPWVFPKAIAKVTGHPKTGDLVAIKNDNGELIGVGAYNETSLYRVRVLALQHEGIAPLDYPGIIQHRLKQAALVRQALQLPDASTTAYRVFNSEADGLSGLTIDRFNNVCVVASSAYWVELNQSLIKDALKTHFPDDHILWSSQAKPLGQDGWEGPLATDLNLEPTDILEAGIIMHVDFANAQKTGLFIDQRENHARIAALAKGKSVLDLYTYTGGFALHAAKAGATRVTAIDSSAQAIEHAQRNAALNQLTQIEFIEADARDYLARASEYDIVVLDPPKLVPSRKHLEKAKNYYRFLHREAFKAMKSGSLLMTCNCSSALNAQEFCNLVSSQAAVVGKQARILGVYGPASCHPVLNAFPEGNYLTAVLIAVL